MMHSSSQVSDNNNMSASGSSIPSAGRLSEARTNSWFRIKKVPTSTPASNASSSHHRTSEKSVPRGRNASKVGTEPQQQAPLAVSPPTTSASPTLVKRLMSVRVITAAMSLLLIALTAAILLAVTFTFSLRAAEDIATDYASVITSKAKGDIESYLGNPIKELEWWQYSLSQQNSVVRPTDHPGYPNDDWTSQWRERMVGPMAASHFTYHSTNIGFADGNALICVTFYPNDQFRCQVYEWGYRNSSNPAERTNLTDYDYYRSNYTIASAVSNPEVYDPRTRTWYKQGLSAPGTITWSKAFLGAVPTVPSISASAGIYNSSGVLIGVASVFLNLNTVAIVLAELLSVKNTVSFLIDNDENILSSTYHLPVVTTTPLAVGFNGTVPPNCLRSDVANGATLNVMVCRFSAAEYAYPPLQQLIQEDPAYVSNGVAGRTFIRKLTGIPYFVSVVPIETGQALGMGWHFALFLPEDELTQGIVRGRDIAIYICVGVVILAAVISLAVITLLLRPLDAVAERMYRVAMMQDVDEATDASNSSLLEVATIQTAFNTMTAELAKIKSFLPQSVLEQLYGNLSEDEGEVESLAGTQVSNTRSRVSRVSDEATGTLDTRQTTTSSDCALNTNVRLSHRKVTMLCLNVLQFHKRIYERSPDQLVRQHDHIVRVVSEICTGNRGVMDGFQGDRFLVSFNAVTSAGNHACLAAHAAKEVCEAVWDRTSLNVSSGIASGPAMVGNVGSATTKRFTVLSPVVSSAVLLERLSKRYCGVGEPVPLVAGTAVGDLESTFDLLTLDSVLLPITKGKSKQTRIYGVMGVKEASADEWMYELQEGNKNSQYAGVNEAFGLFLDGMVMEAKQSVMQQIAVHASFVDTAAENTRILVVLNRLQDLIESATSSCITEEALSVYGKFYANPLSDYYTVCAIPTEAPTTTTTTIVDGDVLTGTTAC